MDDRDPSHFDRLSDAHVQALLAHGGGTVSWWQIDDAVHDWELSSDTFSPTIAVEGWPMGVAELIVVPRRRRAGGDLELRSVVLLYWTNRSRPYQLIRWTDGRRESRPALRGEWTLREYRENVPAAVPADDPGHIVAFSAAPCSIRDAVELVCDQASIKVDELTGPAARRVSHVQDEIELDVDQDGGAHGS